MRNKVSNTFFKTAIQTVALIATTDDNMLVDIFCTHLMTSYLHCALRQQSVSVNKMNYLPDIIIKYIVKFCQLPPIPLPLASSDEERHQEAD